MKQIIWKTVNLEGFNNYEVSNEGEVRNKTTKKLVGYNSGGYIRLDNGKAVAWVHRLVAITFKPIALEEFSKLQVHHIDGDKTNNRPENLKYLTIREHVMEEIRRGTNRIAMRGKDNPSFKGIIGRFNKEGYLLDIYYGAAELERDGYCRTHVYRVVNKLRKTHYGYYWRRFPIDYYPQIGVRYDLNDPMFDSDVYKKRKESAQMYFRF